MEREEWLRRCAARYETRAGLHLKQAQELAEIALDGLFECAPEVLSTEQIPGFLDAITGASGLIACVRVDGWVRRLATADF